MKYLFGLTLPLLLVGMMFSGCSADSLTSVGNGDQQTSFEKTDGGTHQKDGGTHQKDGGTHQKDGGTHQ